MCKPYLLYDECTTKLCLLLFQSHVDFVLEVVQYGEPSQPTKPAVTCLQFQPINPRHKACRSYSVTLYEGWKFINFLLCQRLYCGLLLPPAVDLWLLSARWYLVYRRFIAGSTHVSRIIKLKWKNCIRLKKENNWNFNFYYIFNNIKW